MHCKVWLLFSSISGYELFCAFILLKYEWRAKPIYVAKSYKSEVNSKHYGQFS